MANTAAWSGIRFIFCWRVFFKTYLAGSITIIFFWSLSYLLWVHVLQLVYPVPMIGASNSVIGVLSMVATLWFCFPHQWRRLPHFKRRMKYLSFAQIFILLMSIEYWVLSWVFFVMPRQYQWILAFVLPFTREVGGTLLARISIHTRGRQGYAGDQVSTNLAITYHSLFLSVCIANTATDLTIWVLLVIDFLINICFTVKIYRLKRNFSERNLETICELIQVLVLTEYLEMVIPLGYLICLVAAYYGPNAHILGNIRNSYWQYKEIVDMWHSFCNLAILIAIDSLSFVMSFIMLYFVSDINLLKVLLLLQTEYGFIFAIHQAFLLEYLFCTIAIACAFDFTLQFGWLRERIEKEPDNLDVWNITDNSNVSVVN